MPNCLLFFWRQYDIASSALEVLVASEMTYKHHHKLIILTWGHFLLEIVKI